MNKLLGILPYIYFYDEPIRLGSITLLSVPDTQARDFTPKEETDRAYLQELIKCFPVHRGLKSDEGVIRAFTYFLADNPVQDYSQVYIEARKAITLLRYMMLRPDNQGLNDLETSAVYTFELPPVGNHDTRIYHRWVNFNQEEWITPTHQKFCPPGWHVDCQIKHTSILEDLASVYQQFYSGVLDKATETNILLAVEWYNASFQKYAFHGIEERLIDVSVAFDTLFRLQENGATLYDCVNQTLNVMAGTPIERWSRDFYGKVRSATMHFGKPATLLFKHQNASEGHLSFLWIIGLILTLLGNDISSAGEWASGWFAAGNFSSGVFSAGIFSIGVFSIGIFSIGIFSLGIFSIGLFNVAIFGLGLYCACFAGKGRFIKRLQA